MRGVNKVILLGHVGRDPETRYMPSGEAVSNFSVATTEKWKDKQTGADREATEWHNIVAFRRLAEIVAEYVKKGSPVYLEGKLKTRKWQDKEGRDRYTTEIVADELQMLGSKERSEGRGNTPSPRPPANAVPSDTGGVLDSDIPFAPYGHRSVA